MNQSSKGFLPVSKALIGFTQYKEAEGLSLRSVENYKRDLEKWIEHSGDLSVADVTTDQLRAYLSFLRTEYVPRRIYGQNDRPLSTKTIRNIWVSLSAFFTWATKEFKIADPMDGVPTPKFQKTTILPYTKEHIEALLKACDTTREAVTRFRRSFTHQRGTATRDRALIKVLLDTGLRTNELCSMDIRDYDPKTGEMRVRFGKGGKGRFVYVEKFTRRELWRYLIHREDGNDPTAPLFIARNDQRMNNNSLRLLLNRLGKKAGVPNVHPHRFRHTFAIEFLRGGGDVFSLQKLLGHSTLDMVKNYVAIAQVDIQNAHRRASPVNNWRL